MANVTVGQWASKSQARLDAVWKTAVQELGLVGQGGMSISPTSWQEIESYVRLTGSWLSSWDAQMLMEMSRAYVNWRNKGSEQKDISDDVTGRSRDSSRMLWPNPDSAEPVMSLVLPTPISPRSKLAKEAREPLSAAPMPSAPKATPSFWTVDVVVRAWPSMRSKSPVARRSPSVFIRKPNEAKSSMHILLCFVAKTRARRVMVYLILRKARTLIVGVNNKDLIISLFFAQQSP